MKLHNFVLALTTAALLPALAGAGENMDAVSASFERDLDREFSVKYQPGAVTVVDPLGAINVALRSQPDQVLASFERDLYRDPVKVDSMLAGGEFDPLNVINIAFSTQPDQVVASFERDLYRSPANYKVVPASGEADPLDVIYAVLRCDKSFSISAILKPHPNSCSPV